MQGLPLFDRQPSPRTLTRRDGPASSRKAAGGAIADGVVRSDEWRILEILSRWHGATMREIGAYAAGLWGGDPRVWQVKLNRRTGKMVDRGAIHASGERDGMQLWWKGPDPSKEPTR